MEKRLDAAAIAFQLDHDASKVVIVDREFSAGLRYALEIAKVMPVVIDYDDPEYAGLDALIGSDEYETFMNKGDPEFDWHMPDDDGMQ